MELEKLKLEDYLKMSFQEILNVRKEILERIRLNKILAKNIGNIELEKSAKLEARRYQTDLKALDRYILGKFGKEVIL